MVIVNGLVDFFQLDAFFTQSAALAEDFPRQVMLVEGSILGALGVFFGLFLLITLIKRNAISLIAASVTGMTFLIEALAFGRLNMLPDGSGLVVFSLFLAAVMLFLTATLRAARENAIIGAVLLLAIMGSITLGVLGFLDIYPSKAALQLIAGVLALLAGGLALHQAFAGDRRSSLVAPGVLIASASLVGFFWASRNGLDSWVGFAIPHGMLAGGVILAGLMALLPAGSASAAHVEKKQKRQKKSKRRAKAPTMEPVMSLDDDEEPYVEPDLPDGLTNLSDEDDDDRRAEPVVSAEPVIQQEESQPEERREPQSPISALWGHKHSGPAKQPASPQRNVSEVSALRAGLGAAGYLLWDWSASGQINASEETASLLGVSKLSMLTPEVVRGLIAPDGLEDYDEEILGGHDPQDGRFEFTAALTSGRRLIFKGERRVDEDGLVDRVITFITPARQEQARQSRAAPAAAMAGIKADDIRRGLENGEFEAWFQPVIRLADEEIAGFEALARWRRRGDARPVLPEEFMHTAIDNGLEIEIADLMVSHAAAELAAWIQSNPMHGQFVSFNVSAQTLIDNRLVSLVRREIKKHNLPDGALIVELTESHVLQDQDRAFSVVKALRQAGARIALDDVGQGQSTLNQLSKFRFDIIKTDRSLMDSAVRDQHGHTFMAGLVDMAHRIGTQVIAEGAENADAASVLRDMGCDFAQGYYYGMPEPASGDEADMGDEHHAPMHADLR